MVENEEKWYNGLLPTEKGARFTHSYFGKVECKGHDPELNLTVYSATQYILAFIDGKLLVALDAKYKTEPLHYRFTPDAYIFSDDSGAVIACLPRKTFYLEDFPEIIFDFDEYIDA